MKLEFQLIAIEVDWGRGDQQTVEKILEIKSNLHKFDFSVEIWYNYV